MLKKYINKAKFSLPFIPLDLYEPKDRGFPASAEEAREMMVGAILDILNTIISIILHIGSLVASIVDNYSVSNPYPCSTGKFELECPTGPAWLPMNYNEGTVNIGVSESEVQGSELEEAMRDSDTYKEFSNNINNYQIENSDQILGLINANDIDINSQGYGELMSVLSSGNEFWDQVALAHMSIVIMAMALLLFAAALTYSGYALNWGVRRNELTKVEPVVLIKTLFAIFLWWPFATGIMYLFELINQFILLVSTSVTGNNVAIIEGVSSLYENMDRYQEISINGETYTVPKDHVIAEENLGFTSDTVSWGIQPEGGPSEVDWIERTNGDTVEDKWRVTDWEAAIESDSVSARDLGANYGGHTTSSLLVSSSIDSIQSAIDDGLWQPSISFIVLMIITGIPYLLIALGAIFLWLLRVVALVLLFVLMPILFAISKIEVKGLKTLGKPAQKMKHMFVFLLIISIPVIVTASIYALILGGFVELAFGGPEGFVELHGEFGLVTEIKIGALLFMLMWGPLIYGLSPFFLAKYSSFDPAKSGDEAGIFEKTMGKFGEAYNRARSEGQTGTLKQQHKERGIMGDVEYGLSKTEDKLVKGEHLIHSKTTDKGVAAGSKVSSTIKKLSPGGVSGAISKRINKQKEKVSRKKEAFESEIGARRLDSDLGSASRRKAAIEERESRREKTQQERKQQEQRDQELFNDIYNYDNDLETLKTFGEDITSEQIKNRVSDNAWDAMDFERMSQVSTAEEFYQAMDEEVINSIKENELSMEQIEEIFPNIDSAIRENVSRDTLDQIKALDIYDGDAVDIKTQLSMAGLLGNTVESLLESGELDLSDKFEEDVKEYTSVSKFVEYEIDGVDASDIDITTPSEKNVKDFVEDALEEEFGPDDIISEEEKEKIIEGAGADIQFSEEKASQITKAREDIKVGITTEFMDQMLDRVDYKMEKLTEGKDDWEEVLEDEKYLDFIKNAEQRVENEEVMEGLIDIINKQFEDKDERSKEAWKEIVDSASQEMEEESEKYDDQLIEEFIKYVDVDEIDVFDEHDVQTTEEFEEKFGRKVLERNLEKIGIDDDKRTETIITMIEKNALSDKEKAINYVRNTDFSDKEQERLIKLGEELDIFD